MIDLDHLASLARDATPGPWRADGDVSAVHTWNEDLEGYGDWLNIAKCDKAINHYKLPGQREMGVGQVAANARLIAALSPDVVLALVEMASAATAYVRRTSIVGSPETHEAWRRLERAVTIQHEKEHKNA